MHFAVVLLFITTSFAYQPCIDSKVHTTETILDSPIAKDKPPLWVAPDYKVVLLVTTGKTLYRSEDAGRNFTKVDLPGTPKLRGIFLSSDQKSILAVSDTSNNIHTSVDGGSTWRTLTPPGKMWYFKFHPQRPEYILALKVGCPAFDCSNDLYVSQDFGGNWALLRTYVWVADWHGTSADDITIIAWERNTKSGQQDMPPLESQVVRSPFLFRSPPTVIATEVIGYLAVSTHIFIAKEETIGGLSLLVSVDNGETFQDTRFPGGSIENRYTILDTSEGSTFVNVDHTMDRSSNWGNVYSSSAFYSDFALSLEHNPRTNQGKCDFKRVQGLEGVYLANQFTKTSSDASKIGTGKQTLISYDKGGQWKRLPRPINYALECQNEEDCRLNLYGNSNSGEWYSRSEAIGMIISTGSVGPYIIPNDNSGLGVFFSRDGGWTWQFITNGSYTYEIGNRGAILLMAHDIELTTDLEFSVDEGATWSTCGMVNTSFDVDDIVSDPKMSSGIFLLHGKRGSQGVIVFADFADVHDRDCVGHEAPGNPVSDFEIWTPSDSLGSKCLLGRQTEYIRRKPAAKCDISINITTKDATIVKNCSCTEENYQCDFCFTRIAGRCEFDFTTCTNYDPKLPPKQCRGKWYETRGYRRVPGDTCDPTIGVDHMPIERECPPQAPGTAPDENSGNVGPNVRVDSHATSVIVALVIFAFIALLVVILWYLSGRNSTVRDYATKCIPEKFLPDFKIPGAAYSVLEEDIDNDAPALDIEDDDKVKEDSKTSKDDDFNPRG